MLERLIEWIPAFDKRHPDPSKNYGIHGMEIRFILKGSKGAVQFVVYSDWHLRHVQEELFDKGSRRTLMFGVDVGYHSPTPKHKGQVSRDGCPYLDSNPCYYDGSGLAGDELFWRFVAEGIDVVWEELESRYVELFGTEEATHA